MDPSVARRITFFKAFLGPKDSALAEDKHEEAVTQAAQAAQPSATKTSGAPLEPGRPASGAQR